MTPKELQDVLVTICQSVMNLHGTAINEQIRLRSVLEAAKKHDPQFGKVFDDLLLDDESSRIRNALTLQLGSISEALRLLKQ